jgi:voltage-gated potassium channel
MIDDMRPRTPEDERRLEAFEQRMRMPIFLAAVLPIVLTLSGTESIIAGVTLVLSWFVFVADFVVHVRLVPAYLRSGRGRFDLVVVLLTAPWFLIPGMGTSRFLALARLARLARIAKASGGAVRRLVAQLGRVGLVTAGIVFTCAYVAFGAERSVNEGFSSFGEAVWWATVTITTVGYGDIFPITTEGRISAVVLMFSGLAVLGVLAGALASFFGFGDDHDDANGEDAVAASGGRPSMADGQPDLVTLRARLVELDRAVAAVREHLE